MRSHPAAIKVFAIILLLLFFQKIGGGLYLHNWLHASACNQYTHTTGQSVTSYNCSCIDDFSMPFADDAEKLWQPATELSTEFLAAYRPLVPFSSTFFRSLRAPPFVS